MTNFRKTVLTGALAVTTLFSSSVMAGLVDLSTWTSEGDGNWTLSAG